jgi:hypothetical protein
MHAGLHALFAGAVVLSLASPISAQSRGIELGADVGIGVTSRNGSTVFSVATPTSFRLGMPVGNTMSFEPRVNFFFGSGGGDAFTSIDATLALLMAARGDVQDGPYVALLPVLRLASGFGETVTQFGAGAGAGVRMSRGERFGLRVEGQFVHGFENEDVAGSNEFRALIGVSFFTR